MGDRRVYEIYIQATPQQVWHALTNPDLTEQYFFGTRVESDFSDGSSIRYRNATGGVDADGQILEATNDRRLITTFRPTWSPGVEGADPGTVSWEIDTAGATSKVTLTHAGFDFESPGSDQVHQGWVLTLSGLKTLLETGKPLHSGG